MLSHKNSKYCMAICWDYIFYNFQALSYLISISMVEEVEVFKICLEYWNSLAADLYRESPFSATSSPLLLGKTHNEMPIRRQLYNPVLSRVSWSAQLIASNFVVQCVCYLEAKLSLKETGFH